MLMNEFLFKLGGERGRSREWPVIKVIEEGEKHTQDNKISLFCCQRVSFKSSTT